MADNRIIDKNLAWANFADDKSLEHFDPFAGMIDIVSDDKKRNIRYGIRFCDENYLTPADITTEIVQDPTIYALPNTPIWVMGVINLRGDVVPVFDFNAHPDCENKTPVAKVSNKLIVIDQDKSAVGVFTDNYPVVLDLDNDDISEVSNSEAEWKASGEYLLGAIKVGESIYYEVDYDAFFAKLMHECSHKAA